MKIKILPLILLVSILVACAPQTPIPTIPTILIEFPKIDRYPAAANWERGILTEVPRYDPNSDEQWQMDLRSYDLSELDLRQSLDDLMYVDFDTHTQWPPSTKMPEEFDWQRIMELGKDPGLNMRSLHDQGITGLGVGIAIIDQPLILDHQEYAGQVRLYEEINVRSNVSSQMHGPAVASIAVGKTVGVAPEADLYYIGTWAGDWDTSPAGFTSNFEYYARAVLRILEINQQLPDDRKIRVIAMQVGWSSDQAGYDEINNAVQAAKAAGIFVVSSNLLDTYNFKFHGLGRAPLADPNDFDSYTPGIWWADGLYAGGQLKGQLLVPMDSRTTAGPGGVDEYVFYREGGWSWSTPYIAGMYALAAQVKEDITPDKFWSLALKTGQTIQLEHEGQVIKFGPILDPVALIEAIHNQ